jgi:hypothetical protein
MIDGTAGRQEFHFAPLYCHFASLQTIDGTILKKLQPQDSYEAQEANWTFKQQKQQNPPKQNIVIKKVKKKKNF